MKNIIIQQGVQDKASWKKPEYTTNEMFEEMDEKANIEIYLNPFDEAISEDM